MDQEAQEVQAETTEESADELVEAFIPGFGKQTEETEEAEQSGQQTAPKNEATQDEPGIKNPERALQDDAIFSEQALANKGGLLKARQVTLEARKALRAQADKQHETYVKQEKREARIKTDRDALNRELATFKTVKDQLLADVDKVFNGTGDEALAALGRIAKKSGTEAYEAMTAAIIGQKKDPKAKELDDVKKTLEELRNELKAKKDEEEKGKTEAQRRAQEQARMQWLNDVRDLAEANLDKLPGISHQVEQCAGDQRSIQRLTSELLEWIENEHLSDVRNPSIENRSMQQLILEADAELRKLVPNEKKSQTQQKKAGKPFGAGPSPARAATNGQTKSVFEMSDDERYEQLVNDPNVLSSLGLG